MQDMTATFRRIFLFIALMFFLGTILVLSRGTRTTHQTEGLLRQANAELLAAQVALQAQENSPRMSTQEMIEVAYSVSEIGSMVADIQNRILDYLSNSDFHAYHAAILPLQTLFTSQPYTAVWFPLEAGIAKWTFETIYDASRERVPVLWTLRAREQDDSEAGKLVALVRGVYSTLEGRFVELNMYVTRYSATLIATSPGEYRPDVEVEGENVADET